MSVDLLDAAADVARYFRAFHSYRGSRRIALAALKRRRPGFQPADYERALDAALALFDDAVAFVRDHWSEIPPSSDPTGDLSPFVRQLEKRRPGFDAKTYDWIIAWIRVYYHEM